MKKWQRIWLYFLIIYALIHFVRDIFQDFGVKIFLSTVLVKKPLNPIASSTLWGGLNTYLIALMETVLAIYCLKKNQFGTIGVLTILVAIIVFIAWLIYWVYL